MKCAKLLLTPDANLDIELPLDVGEVCFRVRKVIGIKGEGTPGTKLIDSVGSGSKDLPLVLLHPKAVQVEHTDRTVAILHTLQEACHSLARI
jgi:hypothetical protein